MANKITISKVFLVVVIIIIIVIVIVIGLKKNLINFGFGPRIVRDTTIKIDTLEMKVDTTYIINEWISANAKLFEPTVIRDTIIIDTIITVNNIITKDTTVYKDLYKYESVVSDSLIDGKITTLIDFNNFRIIHQNLDYKPKFPIIITKTIPIVKTVNVTNTRVYKYGLGVDVNSLGDIGIIGAYQTTKGWQFQGAYEINSSIPNNSIRVGIIKLF